MKKTAIIICLLLIFANAAFTDQEAGIIRYALFIGSNTGGFNRVPLEYAVSDARALASVLYEMGGLTKSNSILLSNPDLEEIYESFDSLTSQIIENISSVRRIEFIVYYSGHSDETGLLLGSEVLYYKEFRELINNTGADVNIAILDSCSSGTFTRLKGAKRIAPFLVDESSETSGHAYITSSSANEAAQESDAIGASFFTHYLISALRGAADDSLDGVVTIHEAYAYASSETQSKTENTQAGTQHPSYSMNLSGSGGELILTDLRSTTAGMTFSEEIGGRIYIKDYSGRLVIEARKIMGAPLLISLPPGMYFVTLVNKQNTNTYEETIVQIGFNDKKKIGLLDFKQEEKVATRSRGVEIKELEESKEEQEQANDFSEITGPAVNFIEDLSLPDVSNVSINFISTTKSLNGVGLAFMAFSAGSIQGFQGSILFNITKGPINGFQASSLFNINSGHVNGGQGAALFNINGGNNNGFQGAGLFNINSGNTSGYQGAGLFNLNTGSSSGFQGAGLFNINNKDFSAFQGAGIFNINKGSGNGFQGAGVFNINEGPFKGVQLSGIFNSANNVSGVQISLVNIASNIQGFQLGLVNIGKDVSGTQVGLVNINKDITGIPIGLINISTDGLHDFSFWYTANYDLYGGFQFGTKSLYTIIYGGANTENFNNVLYTGIGVGIRVPFRNLYIEADFSIKQYTRGDTIDESIKDIFLYYADKTVLPSLRLNAGWKLGSLEIFAGVMLDIFNTDGSMQMDSFYPLTDSFPISIPNAIDLQIFYTPYIGFQL